MLTLFLFFFDLVVWILRRFRFSFATIWEKQRNKLFDANQTWPWSGGENNILSDRCVRHWFSPKTRKTKVDSLSGSYRNNKTNDFEGHNLKFDMVPRVKKQMRHKTNSFIDTASIFFFFSYNLKVISTWFVFYWYSLGLASNW